ncbi:cytochrome c oxidase assembly protein [Inquilinus limosus]|uniref:cytochrome c oxidase assembly protein n=1 Tax=Inquilinus limosus TaxID=171674 RepID=UPI003F1661FE
MSEGFLTQHMAAHLAAMNMVAPLCVVAWDRFARGRMSVEAVRLLPAAALQAVLIWGWHLPAVFAAVCRSPVLTAAMHVSLFLSACWFWFAVIHAARRAAWTPLAALLATGKLFCLLGVLLAFSPRPIYASPALPPTCFDPASPWPLVEDQQLAGLLMLTACPLVYGTAAILIARRRLAALARDGGWRFGRRAG